MGRGPVTGTSLANAPGTTKRNSTDFYATPSKVTRALLLFLKIPKTHTIWEPASGNGMMSRELQNNGYTVISTNLHDQGFGETGIDFLSEQGSRGADWIITNPPFSLAAEFIRKALSFGVEGVAILLKSQYWHASSRYSLFEQQRPTFVLPLTWRPDFLFGQQGGRPTMECLWTVWKGRVSGRAQYRPLERPG